MKPFECLKCGSQENESAHHVYPKRRFKKHCVTVSLCRPCHDKIEALIKKIEGKSKGNRVYLDEEEYLKILIYFLAEGL